MKSTIASRATVSGLILLAPLVVHAQVAPDGPRAPAAVLGGVPRNLVWTGHTPKAVSPLPTSQTPAPVLDVLDVQNLPRDQRYAAVCLQGIVNRSHPSVYLLQTETDAYWLGYMKQRGWVRSSRTIADLDALVQKYRSKLRGVEIADNHVAASINVACMLAGVDNGLVVSPSLARHFGLPVLHDLRGRWSNNAAAYAWAFDHLWPRLSHNVISFSTGAQLMPRDYLVQNRVFSFWVTGPIDGALPGANPTAEARLMERLLAKMPANIACLGYPYAGEDVGIGENPGVSLLSKFGKYLIATDWSPNMSVLSGIHLPAFKQRHPAAPRLQRDKVYVSFIMSDGDNLQVLSKGSFKDMWSSPLRGHVPVGWSMSPSAGQLVPPVADFYYRNASAADEMVAAVSGVGYMYPDDYGQRFRPVDAGRVFNGFLDQTAASMQRMDMKDAWIMGGTRSDVFARYAERIPWLNALFPDYGRQVTSYDTATGVTSRNVPVFRAAAGWGGAKRRERVNNAVREILGITPASRPAFMHVFVQNWQADLPTLERVLDRLGTGYIAVRPDQLAILYRQQLRTERIQIKAPNAFVGVQGRKLRTEFTVQNVTPQTMRVVVKRSGALGNGTKAVTLVPGKPWATTVSEIPRAGGLKISASAPGITRNTTRGLSVIAADELLGTIPPGTLRYVGRFEAEVLQHRAGRELVDPAASGGIAWLSTPPPEEGQLEPGFAVYGPYIGLTPGQYVAIFRVKQAGEGSGSVANLDVSANGGHDILATRRLSTDDLPNGAYRSVVLPFTYRDGTIETRVQWTGAIPIAIDAVTIFEILPNV